MLVYFWCWWWKAWACFFVLYLILGNVEEGFSGGEKVNTPYKSFPWGPAIVFPKTQSKRERLHLNHFPKQHFLYQHLDFPCLNLCCPDKKSEFFALCDFDGGRHQQPDVLEKDLNIFCFFIIFYVLVLLFSWRTVTPHGAMWLWWGSPATSCFSKQMATLTRPMPFGTAEGDKDCSDGQGISLISMIFAIKETIFKRFGKGPKQLISSLHSAA